MKKKKKKKMMMTTTTTTTTTGTTIIPVMVDHVTPVIKVRRKSRGGAREGEKRNACKIFDKEI